MLLNIHRKDLFILQKLIYNFLKKKNSALTKRYKKTNIFDAIVYRLLYGYKDASQNKIVADINFAKNNFTKKDKISRTSLIDRENQIHVNVYESINNICDIFISKYKNPNIKNIIAVDGTHTHLYSSLKNEFTLNKNQKSSTPLVLGVFNVTYNMPECLDLVTHKNERKAFLNYINKNIHNLKNSIFVLDRGFMDDSMFAELTKKGINFVCRIRNNATYIPKTDDDCVKTKFNQNLRVVTYVINKTTYYLATNLFDSSEFSINILKSIYHDRWSVEEYFKHLKSSTHFSIMPEEEKTKILKTINCQLLVNKLTYIISNIAKNTAIKSVKNDSNIIINKQVLNDGLFKHFIFKFFYSINFNKLFLRRFFSNYVKFIKSNKGKHFERVSSIPYSKFYIKKYYNRYINDENNKEANKERQKRAMANMKNKKMNIT